MQFHAAAALAFLTAAASAVAALPAAMDGRSQPPGPVGRAAEHFNLGLRGVYFVENQGQWSDATVYFGLKSRGLDVAFRDSSFTMHLARPIDDATDASRGRGSAPPRIDFFNADDLPIDEIRGVEDSAPAYEHLTLTITFPGSNPVTPHGAQPQTAKFNYFVGGEGRGTASNVPSFGAVIYEDLYDGIDLLVCGNDDGVMKYEFHCEPGADYSQIRIHYDGIDSLCVNAEGDLEIATSFGTFRDGAPIVWQEDIGSTSRRSITTSRAREEAEFDVARAAPQPDGRRSSDQTIPARFEVIDDHTYRFALEHAADPRRPLVIDPEVEWVYYLGGGLEDDCSDVAVDAMQNAFVTGSTVSNDFEGRNNDRHGGVDTIVAKMSDEGVLLWMTYLGGSEFEYGSGIALDVQGTASVTGATSSRDFEGRTNSHHGGSLLYRQDAFVARVGPDGTLQWMRYLGGNGDDAGTSLAITEAGDIRITGVTHGGEFEGANNWRHGDSDAFVVSVNGSGLLQWMTYLGGTAFDSGRDLACDGAGSVFVTGYSASTDFEGRINAYHGGTFDAFVAAVSAEGIAQWMTYIGGSLVDYAGGVCIDSGGAIFVAGETRSVDFEGRMNAFHGGPNDAFLLKLDGAGLLHWMDYLGGSDVDSIEISVGVAVDSVGTLVVAGGTQSVDFEARQNSHYGSADAFAAWIDSQGLPISMIYLGGIGSDVGADVAIDREGWVWVTGDTSSNDFDGRINASRGGPRDGFLVRIRAAEAPRLSSAATCPAGGPLLIEWSGASPGGQVALIFARNTGSFIIPNNRPCAGTELGLGSNQIQLAWQGGAGQNGSRTLNSNAGPGACGGYLQLLDLTTCSTSNVARIE